MNTTPPPADHDFETFYAKHLTLARRWASRMGMSDADAEDVAQDVLLSAHGHFARIQPDKRRSWLFTAVLHEVINQQRKRRRRAAAAPLDPQDPDPQEPTPTPRIMALETLRAAFDRLSEQEREILVRHEIDGQTLEQIAQELGVSRTTAQARVAAARARFCKRVDEFGGLPEQERSLLYAIFPFVLLATMEKRASPRAAGWVWSSLTPRLGPGRLPRGQQLAIAVPSVLAGVLIGAMLQKPLTAQASLAPMQIGLGAAVSPSVPSSPVLPADPTPSAPPASAKPQGLEVASRRELDDLLRAREVVAKDPAAALAMLRAHARQYPQSQHAARRRALVAQARASLTKSAGPAR
jgi:RNA polymerase sigma-70 factor (ECF subfamily)